jgi:hypothetical protein
MKATSLILSTITIFLFFVMFCYTEDRYEAGQGTDQVTIGDFNNDGYIDFCINNIYDNSIYVFLNKGDGKYNPPVTYTAERSPNKVIAADLNNDGLLELILTYGPKVIDIYFNDGDGNFGRTKKYNCNYFLTNNPPTVTDINNDGWLDLLFAANVDYSLIVMLNNGDGNFTDPYPAGTIYNPQPFDSPQIADIDNDGFKDVFVTSVNYGGTTSSTSFIFLKNKGNGTFNEPVIYKTTSVFSQVTLIDVDNDGFIDVLCNNPDSNNISIFYNNKDGTFNEPVNYDTGSYPSKITPTDINKDGWIDLLVTNMDSKNLSIFLNKGNGTFKNPVTYITGERPRPIVASDLNNDGWIDMIVSCNPLKFDGTRTDDIKIYLNKGDGTFAESVTYGKGDMFVPLPEIVDIDNDGWLDIIQSNLGGINSVNGYVSVFRNVGKGKFDNSGIDLRTVPYEEASLGNDVKIIVDFRTFPISVNADLYFVMVNPQGTIYLGLAWNEGIFPALRNLTLPPDTNLFDITLCEFTIPSQKPLVSALGKYTFAMGAFKSGTAESLSNIAITSFNVIGQ